MSSLTAKKYWIAELVKDLRESEATVLSLGDERGLIFSCMLDYARLELGRFDKNGDLIAGKVVEYDRAVLDLHPSVITDLRRSLTKKVRPRLFLVRGWDQAHWYGKKCPHVAIKDLFVTAENRRLFVEEHPEFRATLRLKEKQKPGTKPIKLEGTISRMLEDMREGKLEALLTMKQESLANEYGVSRGVAVRARKEALDEFDKNCQS